MERVKGEEHIKDQFQKREIQPSAGSWEKLQERLEHKERRTRPELWWLGIAASIAAIFFVSGTFFNDSIDPDNPVVEEKPFQQKNPQEKVETPITIPEEEVLVAAEKAPNRQELMAERVPQKAIPERKAIAVVSREHLPLETLPEAEREPLSEIAVTQVASNSSEVTDAEIEALLAEATARIGEDPAFAVETVNARELLEEVEHELDQNFRQKVFEVLKEGFSRAKTAVANRNY